MLALFWYKTYEYEEAMVKRVIDGDTIELENGEIVRYIGIDTPETSPPLTPIECYGPEATEYNRELVEGKTITMRRDIKNKDKFGRILRYVYINDQFVNMKLLKEGYARYLKIFPNVSFARQFLIEEKSAQKNKVGLWNQETCDGNR